MESKIIEIEVSNGPPDNIKKLVCKDCIVESCCTQMCEEGMHEFIMSLKYYKNRVGT